MVERCRKPPPLMTPASIAMPIAGRRREARRLQVEDAEIAAAVGREPERLRDAEAFDRDRHGSERNDDRPGGGEREVRCRSRHARLQAVDHDAGQAHGVRPLRAEADAAIEMKAGRVDLEQQLAFQDDAGARQEDPEQVADGRLRDRDLEAGDADRRAPGVQADKDFEARAAAG